MPLSLPQLGHYSKPRSSEPERLPPNLALGQGGPRVPDIATKLETDSQLIVIVALWATGDAANRALALEMADDNRHQGQLQTLMRMRASLGGTL